MRYHSNLAGEMILSSAVSNSDTVLSLSSVTGLPASYPFTLVVDVGSASEEVVTVSAVFGTNVTVTRGEDGTSPVAHSTGAVVRHMASARDYTEPQSHIAATTGVHGTTGALVGTTDTQALTNKTINGSLNTLTNVPKSALPSDTTYNATAQTLTNKTLDGSANTFSNIPKAALPADIVDLATAQTLTNKSIAATQLTGTVAKANLPGDTVYLTDTTPGTFLTTASGWTDASSFLRVRNGIAYVRLSYTRSGAAITSSSGSGAVSDSLICTLNVSYRPEVEMTTACRYGGTVGGWLRWLANGEVYFIHGAPGVDLANGDSLVANLAFPV